MAELDGQVVVVTGTSQGIGVGIVERCLEAGARVLGVSRRGTGGPAESGDYRHLALDVTSAGAARLTLDAALKSFGRIDALVNNAGTLSSANFWEHRDDDWDRMVALNLTAPFALSQAFARHWKAGASHGTVVNICSIESEIGWLDLPEVGYAATKGALLSLTRAFAYELAADGIRTVAIGPGVIASDMTDMSGEPDAMTRRIPLARFGKPGEIGDATVFLLSERASYVTGEILYVDGGYRLP